MDLETFRWLLTDDGQRLIGAAATAYADHDGDPVGAANALRGAAEVDPDRRAAALTQVQLRVRAVPKFGEDALRMYFTPDGLEQATRDRVAEHRAARLVAADVGSVIDLGCGIGGDLVAFARAGLTTAGIDADPVRVADRVRQPRGPRPGRRGPGRGRHHPRPLRVRRRLRRPRAPLGTRAGLRRGRLDAAVAVRGRAARRRRPAQCREGRPGHPALPGARRRRGRVGERVRRGEGGGVVVVGPGDLSPPGHRDRHRRARHPHRGGRPVRRPTAAGARRSARTSTSPTEP